MESAAKDRFSGLAIASVSFERFGLATEEFWDDFRVSQRELCLHRAQGLRQCRIENCFSSAQDSQPCSTPGAHLGWFFGHGIRLVAPTA